MTEFMPGDPLNSDIAANVAAVEPINQQLDIAESVIDETDAAIVVPVATDIKEAESVLEQASGTILGGIEIAVEQAEQLIGKLTGKIAQQLTDMMIDVYTNLTMLGIDVPTEEELAYEEANLNGPQILVPAATPTLPPGVIPQAPSDGGPVPPIAGQCPDGYRLSVNDNMCYKVTYTQGGSGSVPGPMPTPSDTRPCPPGYHFVPASTGDQNDGSSPIAMGGRGPNPLSVVPCDPPITSGWFENYSPSFPGVNSAYMNQFPSLNPPPAGHQGLIDTESVAGCHFRPPMNGNVTLHFDAGLFLVYDPTDGRLYASNVVQPGWVRWSSVQQTNPGDGNGDEQWTGGECVADEPAIGQCPSPDQLCGTETQWPEFPSDQINEDVCKQIEDAIKGLEGTSVDIAKFITMRAGFHSSSWVADAIINAITGGSEPILSGLTRRFAEWMQKTVKGVANSTACDSPAALTAWLKLALMRFIDHWTDIIPDAAIAATEHTVNSVCQYNLPTGPQADSAYLADTIDEKEWECWHKANGNLLGPAKKVLLSKRTTPTPNQLDLLFRREKIDYQAMKDGMREQGVIRDEDEFRIRDLNEWWPTASNIIPYMVRDVFDPEAVERGKLDEDFEKKFTGEAEKLADGAGIKKELMRYEWRRHWHIPSYTMGREWLFRFDDPSLPENLRFGKEEFRLMLKQDDWAPGYVDRMIEAAYHPINMSDATKAYMIHAIDEQELKKRLKHVGYSEDTSEFMKNYYKRRRELADKKGAGYPTMRSAVSAYARCELAENEFREIVDAVAITKEQGQIALRAADISRKMWERKQTIRTVKKPYLLGLYDEFQAREALEKAGTDAGCIRSLIEQWDREKLRRDKYLSASQLCQMYERGIITERDMVIALVRSGWDERDAVLITANCGAMVSEKLAKRARIESEKAARQLKQQLREQEKARRLAECGPPPCPANRNQNGNLSAVGP